MRTKTESLDPIAITLEAFEPPFEAADPDVQSGGGGPFAHGVSLGDGVSGLF